MYSTGISGSTVGQLGQSTVTLIYKLYPGISAILRKESRHVLYVHCWFARLGRFKLLKNGEATKTKTRKQDVHPLISVVIQNMKWTHKLGRDTFSSTIWPLLWPSQTTCEIIKGKKLTKFIHNVNIRLPLRLTCFTFVICFD